MTALTGPPAIIPVPSGAGLKKTVVAPNLPIISCGIVFPLTILTSTTCLFAFSTAFLIASGTSPLLPVPNPNLPLPLPMTTRAENFILLPPLTTFVTLLIWTTLSSYSFTTSLRGWRWKFFLFLLNLLLPSCAFSSLGAVASFVSSTFSATMFLFSSIVLLLRILSHFHEQLQQLLRHDRDKCIRLYRIQHFQFWELNIF